LQHWLEAIDPRHRYGHNLHIYYDVWSKSESTEPFFYWLDIGEGKEINLEKCPRSKLQSQCIKYLGPQERQQYEVVVEGGKLVFRQTGALVHSSDDSKSIFVLSTTKAFYVGQVDTTIYLLTALKSIYSTVLPKNDTDKHDVYSTVNTIVCLGSEVSVWALTVCRRRKDRFNTRAF
jgi:hypothetical protein